MAMIKETAVIGGRLKMRKAGSGLPFTPVGLSSSVQQTHETNEIRLEDATNPLGGTYDKLEKVTSMGIAINLREINSRNLGVLLFGTVINVPSAAAQPEDVVVAVGGTSMLSKMPLTITSVKDTVDPLISYVEDVDYMITGAGIEVLEGGDLAEAIDGAADYQVTVTYTSADYDEIEALTDSGQEWELLFEGGNAVGTKGKINAHYWRVRFGLAQSMDFINVEDFLGLPATAEVLADSGRGVGKSAYMKINKQNPVAVAP
jgi:hypothetical protein